MYAIKVSVTEISSVWADRFEREREKGKKKREKGGWIERKKKLFF